MEKVQKYWFKAKSFGYGWTPCSREGWIVMIAYTIAIILIGIRTKDQLAEGKVANFLIWIFGLTIILIIIAYKTGEKPKWRWGFN